MNLSQAPRRWPATIAAAFALLAVGCGGDDDEPAAVVKSCSELSTTTVGAAAIGLPTGGAAVTSSVAMSAGGAGAGAYGAYCLVSGEIKPIDPSAPNIKFQVALPDTWNGKALMLGGGGWNGSIPSLTSSAQLWGTSKSQLPLGRGYAVFGSDSGHQLQPGVSGGSFASNFEALRNYSGDALKKTRDVAMALIAARYGTAPAKSYFLGYSKGGGEALTVMQRWPSDWDGIVAGAPGWNFTAVGLQMLAASQAVAAPGAWLNETKRTTLYNTVLGVCDGLDGAKDGLISNVRACAVQFNPSAATYNGAPLRCPNGADTGDDCLSDAQLMALRQVDEPLRLSYALGSGETSLLGFPVYITDHGGATGTAAQKAAMAWLGGYGAIAPAFPPTEGMASKWELADSFTRDVIVVDRDFNPLTFNVATGSGFTSRIETVSALDANNSDVSPFMNRGGKLLLWTGTNDMHISPRATEFFYGKMKAAMGAGKVDSFVRFYQIPGSGHGPSSVFQPEWEQVQTIENWVEKGIDPANNIIVTDDAGVAGRTRPMCPYPTWPKYKGSGDVNTASSFVCISSDRRSRGASPGY